MKDQPPHHLPKTRRQAEKEQRYRDLIDAAGQLFGTYGYAQVALDDIGAAVGISGQAIYRHFTGKQDMLGQLLLTVSQRLLDGGQRIVGKPVNATGQSQNQEPPARQLRRLIDFHVDFALNSPEVIRVQEQELPRLLPQHHRDVRRMQREYIELWNTVIQQIHPQIEATELRIRVHGAFGLINSTAHSLKSFDARPPSRTALQQAGPTLAAMAEEALVTQFTDC